MQVKDLPTRLRCDSLPAHADQTRFLESEAGNRVQPDIQCGVTLVLTGSSYGETEPKKATYEEAGTQTKDPDLTGVHSRHTINRVVARVQGIQ